MTLARTLLDTYFENLLDGSAPSGWCPSVYATETSKAFLIQVDVPGVAREDLKIQCDRGTITLAGERRSPRLSEGENALRTEARYGKFTRHFTLPESAAIDGIEANLNEGVLMLRIPKTVRATLSREIKIS